MIYYRAERIEEVQQLLNDQAGALVYSGGSEIVTLRRSGKIAPQAVIDLQGIEVYGQLEHHGDRWWIGGGVTLNRLAASGILLLDQVSGKIADHTVRNTITLAGNVCGRLPYRETAAALLMLDAEVELVGPDGPKTRPMREVFQRRMMLEAGQWVLGFRIPKIEGVARTIRETRHDSVDYPIVHMMGLKQGATVVMGCAGLTGYPFVFEDGTFSVPSPVTDDLRAGAEYRVHLARMAYESIREGWA